MASRGIDSTQALSRPELRATLDLLVRVRRWGEEVVMTEPVWIDNDEDPLAELREEWEQTRTPDVWLAGWAERIQDAPETGPATAELEQLADDWALPVTFLHELLAAPIPGQFLADNHQLLAEAADIRFNRTYPR